MSRGARRACFDIHRDDTIQITFQPHLALPLRESVVSRLMTSASGRAPPKSAVLTVLLQKHVHTAVNCRKRFGETSSRAKEIKQAFQCFHF